MSTRRHVATLIGCFVGLALALTGWLGWATLPPGYATTGPGQSDEIRILKAQLLELEIKAREAKIRQMQQAAPVTEEHLAKIARMEAELQQMQQKFDQLARQGAVPSVTQDLDPQDPKALAERLRSVKARLRELQAPALKDQINQEKQPDPLAPNEALLVPPANDTCAGATPITCPGSITQSTVGATADGPADCTGTNFNSVWFTFTGDGAAHTFSTAGSNYAGLSRAKPRQRRFRL